MGRPEMYSLREDPTETRNLFNPEEAQSKHAAEQLLAWSRMVTQRIPGPAKVDRETMERLRSLGYVGQ